VEQLQQINSSLTASKASQDAMAKAIDALQSGQASSTDMLTQMLEGQMAMATVGKTGVAEGDSLCIDRSGSGTIMVDTGTVTGPGRVTVKDAAGHVVGQAKIASVSAGTQAFAVQDLGFTPPLPAGKYSYTVEVATDGGQQQWQQVKTYTTGRITGLKYQNGVPMLSIGDVLTLPMSKLTQIRG
jgi:flagellar basal-body rod modification protein FlgD